MDEPSPLHKEASILKKIKILLKKKKMFSDIPALSKMKDKLDQLL